LNFVQRLRVHELPGTPAGAAHTQEAEDLDTPERGTMWERAIAREIDRTLALRTLELAAYDHGSWISAQCRLENPLTPHQCRSADCIKNPASSDSPTSTDSDYYIDSSACSSYTSSARSVDDGAPPPLAEGSSLDSGSDPDLPPLVDSPACGSLTSSARSDDDRGPHLVTGFIGHPDAWASVDNDAPPPLAGGSSVDSDSDPDLPLLVGPESNRARLSARLAEADAHNRSDIALDIAHLRTTIAGLDEANRARLAAADARNQSDTDIAHLQTPTTEPDGQPTLGAQEYTRLVNHLLGPGRSRPCEQRNPASWICGQDTTLFTIDVSAAYGAATRGPP
jgi:hypothetical protein